METEQSAETGIGNAQSAQGAIAGSPTCTITSTSRLPDVPTLARPAGEDDSERQTYEGPSLEKPKPVSNYTSRDANYQNLNQTRSLSCVILVGDRLHQQKDSLPGGKPCGALAYRSGSGTRDRLIRYTEEEKWQII